MLATVLSRAQFGMEAPQVSVEAHLGAGLPHFNIVGLPEVEVREAKDRVRSALANANFSWPAGRVTINLAPADLPKEGGRFDLPIAVGLLVASEQIRTAALNDCEFYGELSLSGDLRGVRGMLPAVVQASLAGRRVVLPHANSEEAALVRSAQVAGARHLLEVCSHLTGAETLRFERPQQPYHAAARYPDLADVRGQTHAKRALAIAAAGGHSLLFTGPPGTGKSMLAQRLPGILPLLTEAEALETAAIASVSGRGFRPRDWARRPFRSPHHTASRIALVGGGSKPRPGEISLAHNGVLFLDELPEFDRHVLEVMREPLETGTVTISRAAQQAEFPARFQLICAMNPCPCGHLGERDGRCHCSAELVERYRARISGPLLDRIDLFIEVPRVEGERLFGPPPEAECSPALASRVAAARELQLARQECCNAWLDNAGIQRHCQPDRKGRALLERAMQRFDLSARACHRILKVARTIADLAADEHVRIAHVSEAITLRKRERNPQE